MKNLVRQLRSPSTDRRSFLKKGLAAGSVTAAGLMTSNSPLLAQRPVRAAGITPGDVAILRFLAAAEIVETDLWQQYNELGGVQDSEAVVTGSPGSGAPAYAQALQNLDGDMSQYIHDNTEDEISHFQFINAYVMSKGLDPVNLDRFRTLKGSQATGANKSQSRLTNLMELTVDTTYWGRYRSRTENPDLDHDAQFAAAVPALLKGKFPAIPRDDSDLPKNPNSPTTDELNHIQAIANTAAFHFAFIEQGGSSLYPSLAQRVTSPEVLRILLSIGPTETAHFQTWHDKAGNAIVPMLAPLTDPKNPTLTFPDQSNAGEDLQPNLIMPEPCPFLNLTMNGKFVPCSIIRPTETEGAAMGAVNGLNADGLFIGNEDLVDFLRQLAFQADLAQRGD